MTSDGIRSEDWDRVHELAVEIVNAGEGEEGVAYVAELLAYLKQLEQTYGALPSILATRADYVGDPEESLRLLNRAYDLAKERQDPKNTLYAASSLASLYLERGVTDDGEKWLQRFSEALKYAGDESDIEEHESLVKRLDELRAATKHS